MHFIRLRPANLESESGFYTNSVVGNMLNNDFAAFENGEEFVFNALLPVRFP